MENLYVRDNTANYEWIKEAVKQAEEGVIQCRQSSGKM